MTWQPLGSRKCLPLLWYVSCASWAADCWHWISEVLYSDSLHGFIKSRLLRFPGSGRITFFIWDCIIKVKGSSKQCSRLVRWRAKSRSLSAASHESLFPTGPFPSAGVRIRSEEWSPTVESSNSQVSLWALWVRHCITSQKFPLLPDTHDDVFRFQWEDFENYSSRKHSEMFN